MRALALLLLLFLTACGPCHERHSAAGVEFCR